VRPWPKFVVQMMGSSRPVPPVAGSENAVARTCVRASGRDGDRARRCLEALLKPLADGVLAVHPLHRENVSRPMPDFGRIPVRADQIAYAAQPRRRLTTPSMAS